VVSLKVSCVRWSDDNVTLMRLTAVVAIILVTASRCFCADPFVGSWVMNLEKSEPKRRGSFTTTYAAEREGYRVTMEMDAAGGKVYHVEFVTNLDGKDAPVTGHPGFDMIAVKKVGIGVLETVAKRQGRVVQIARRAISNDGKTLVVSGKDISSSGSEIPYTTVFDKK